jgi:hypothetical protein
LLLHEHFTEGTLRELHEALLDETALIFRRRGRRSSRRVVGMPSIALAQRRQSRARYQDREARGPAAPLLAGYLTNFAIGRSDSLTALNASLAIWNAPLAWTYGTSIGGKLMFATQGVEPDVGVLGQTPWFGDRALGEVILVSSVTYGAEPFRSCQIAAATKFPAGRAWRRRAGVASIGNG